MQLIYTYDIMFIRSDMMKKERKPLLYRICYRVIKLFYPKIRIDLRTQLKAPGNIYVSNHAQAHGPLSHYFYFPQNRFIWVIGQMSNRKEVTPYAMEDFWRMKSKWTKFFYKLFSITILAPLASFLMRSADAIPVYKDARLKITMTQTINRLDEGNDVIIFPENRGSFNKFINEFQIHFVDVARRYCKRTNKPLYFYPVYTCADLKTIFIGEPTLFDSSQDINIERMRIINYLQTEITKLAESLPNHVIVPYINIKRKYRQKSKE
jgi:hypothetical protein